MRTAGDQAAFAAVLEKAVAAAVAEAVVASVAAAAAVAAFVVEAGSAAEAVERDMASAANAFLGLELNHGILKKMPILGAPQVDAWRFVKPNYRRDVELNVLNTITFRQPRNSTPS